MFNYQLFQKLKLIGRDKFNHLIDTLTILKYAHYRVAAFDIGRRAILAS
jgi:hypothetical protein